MPVEEQTQHNASLGTQYHLYSGQRLTIPNREVSKLGFWLAKVGSPVGDVYFQILKASNDDILVSKKWGNATDLTVDAKYKEVTFDSPVVINEEVRMLCFFDGALSTSNYVVLRVQHADVKAGEQWTRGEPPTWTDYPDYDAAYRYTYGLPSGETAYNTMVGSPTSWLWEKCGYGGAEKCPVGSEPSWTWQAPISEGPNETPQGGPLSFIWGSE